MRGRARYVLAVALALLFAMLPGPTAFAAVNAKVIDDPVPSAYLSPAEQSQQGEVVQEKYTVSSGAHAGLEKYIYVYLPAGYDDPGHGKHRDKYDVFYFMHGQGGTAYELLGDQFNGGQIKSMTDHMIADGKIEPAIVVAVTWNTNAGLSGPNSAVISSQGGDAERQAFHDEFESDVMPLIETRYRTHAGLATPTESPEEVGASEPIEPPDAIGTSERAGTPESCEPAGGPEEGEDAASTETTGQSEGVEQAVTDEGIHAQDSSSGVPPADIQQALKDSRDHRGFGGFSYGAHTTWYQLRSDVDYIRYFAPMSGGLTNLYDEIMDHRHDYELCCVTGTADVTRGQCDAIMGMYNPGDAAKVGYYKISGATHSYSGYRQYLYAALLELYGDGVPAESAKDDVGAGGSAGGPMAGGRPSPAPSGGSAAGGSTIESKPGATPPAEDPKGDSTAAPPAADDQDAADEPSATPPPAETAVKEGGGEEPDFTLPEDGSTSNSPPAAIAGEDGNRTGAVTKGRGATTFTVKLSKPIIKAKILRKKKQACTIEIAKLSEGSSKPTYEIKSVSKGMRKYVSISKSGKVTVKKGCNKCKIKVTVTSKANKKRGKLTKVVTIAVM